MLSILLLMRTALMANPMVGWRLSDGSPASVDSSVDLPTPVSPRHRTENSGFGSGGGLQHSLRQHCTNYTQYICECTSIATVWSWRSRSEYLLKQHSRRNIISWRHRIQENSKHRYTSPTRWRNHSPSPSAKKGVAYNIVHYCTYVRM